MVRKINRDFGWVDEGTAKRIREDFKKNGYKTSSQGHYGAELVSEIIYKYKYHTLEWSYIQQSYVITGTYEEKIIARAYIYPRVQREVSRLTTTEFVSKEYYSGESLSDKLGGEQTRLGA